MAKTKDVRNTTGSPLQRLVREACRQQGITRYKLAVACGWPPNSVYRKLKEPIVHGALEKMLAFLEAEVQVGGCVMSLRLKEGKVVTV